MSHCLTAVQLRSSLDQDLPALSMWALGQLIFELISDRFVALLPLNLTFCSAAVDYMFILEKPTSKCWFEKLQWRLGLALVFLLSSWGWTIHDNQSDFWPEELSEEFKSLRPGIMRTTEQWRNYIDYVIGYTTVNKRHHSWANLRDKTRLWALTALNFLKKQADVVCIFNLREMNEDFTIWDFLYFSFIRNKKESCSSF